MNTELTVYSKVKTGRPLSLNPKLQEEFIEALKSVRYLNLASDIVGIHVDTINRWRKYGAKHEKDFHPEASACTDKCDIQQVAFRSFYVAVKQAIAIATRKDLDEIQNIAKRANKWEGIAWTLERTNPAQFGLKSRVEHVGEGGGPIKHKLLAPDRQALILKAAQESLAIETQQDEDGTFVPVEDE